jgi:type I restriction enzyme S subunit
VTVQRARLGALVAFLPKSSRKASDGEEVGEFPFFTSSQQLSKRTRSPAYNQESLVFGTGGGPSVHHASMPFDTSADCLVATPRNHDATCCRYLYWYLSAHTYVLEDGFRGAGLKHVAKAYLESLEIPMPSIAEQRRIVGLLDRAEALRVKRRAALARLDTLTQSIFVDMFGDRASSSQRWRQTELGALCDRVIDCPHSTPTYSLAKTGYLCVRSSDLQNGYLVLSDTRHVDQGQYEERVSRGRPLGGDVLYCREGARFGNTARIPHGLSVCLGQRMMLLRPREDIAVGEYLWAFLMSREAQRQAASTVAGSASPHVNIRDIVAFRLPQPPVALQRGFAIRVRAVDKVKVAHQASLAELDALFAAVQDRAFRSEF